MSIKTNEYRFEKNGKYHLILSGEIHYFRLPKNLWNLHLDLALEAGINTITTYVPWIVHEEIYRSYNFNESNDLPYFLSLCKTKNLDVIIKPGPFVMAEIKNEGLPYWLYEKYPEIIPDTWKKNKVTTPIVDYLNPLFLQEVNIWYKKLFQVIKDYTSDKDGPIIGVQLDNEIGMLSWVSNQPELTPDIIKQLTSNMPNLIDPFNPNKDISLKYHHELTNIMRKRYETYVLKLTSFINSLGLNHLLLFINIHGTSNSRGKTFPIGISQLIDTYNKHSNILAGMDLYFGNIDLENFHDLYIVNSFVESTSLHKPYGTLELNVADGNFGDNLAIHYLPSSIDFKIRFAIIQNQKILNYYLLSAGINPKLKNPKANDLNQRVAITGARHGFAAPLQIDGTKQYTYNILKKTTKMLQCFNHEISTLKESTDDIAICFIMDSYQTEYQIPGEDNIRHRNDNLSLHRNSVFWDTLLKQMLLLQYRFSSLWLENQIEIPKHIKLLVTNTSSYMAKETQLKFINYLKSGGKIIFVGDLPIYDLEGLSETALIDYLKIKPINNYFDWEDHLLTLTSDTLIYGESEFRSFIAQSIKSNETPLFSHLITGEKIGIKSKQYIWITSNYPGHLAYTKDILDHLNIKPHLKLENQSGFILAFKQTYNQVSAYHLINLEHFKQSVKLYDQDEVCFDNHDIEINSQEALLLWNNIKLNDELFIYSTAEIQSFTKNQYVINTNLKHVYLKIKSPRKLISDSHIIITKKDDLYYLEILDIVEQITITFSS